ncbi:unnamed protein product [Hymenolepis diminuta]|uniref:Innexin n=1 Tax=Hymenolepis diminuta TaxID=6216 RepID=A0A564XVC1_HYMDI|nr:unnamed protein product [Hymenolepis diminuta]
MAKLLEDALKIYKEANDHSADLEDLGDRFNYIGCVVVLFVCTVVVSTKQYFFKPISCFIATEVGGSNLLDYVENYCWIQGTVPITYTGQIPANDDEWNALEEKKIPDALRAPISERQIIINEIADSMEYLFNKRFFPNMASTVSHIKCPYKINIITSYLIVKVLYLINAIGQLVVMKQFLGFNSFTDFGYGLSMLSNVLHGRDWQVTQIFPRVGYCYVEIKFLGASTNAVTAQCVLPLNMLNEKIYLFLWWWISAATIITIFYLILWAFRFGTQNREINYILKYLQLSSNRFRRYDEREVENFSTRYLGREGTFLVRMIRMNAGEQMAVAVVKAFWKRYRLAVVDHLRRGFSRPNVLMSPESIIMSGDIYPQFKSFSRRSSKTGSDLVDRNIASSQAYV